MRCNIVSFMKLIYRSFFPHRINGEGNVLNNCSRILINIQGNNNSVTIDKGALVNCTINIIGNDCTIEIGKGSTFRSGSIIIEGNRCNYTQGELSGIRDAKFVIQEDDSSITIGDECMFSYNILMRTSDSHSILNIDGDRINPAKSIKIGNHVWIAESVTILKGVCIGDNSIVGYGSVCTKDFPSNVIASGVPARIVKDNINWSNKLI
ncbi:MAG: acyltransferase [Bacteroidales bacterium]